MAFYLRVMDNDVCDGYCGAKSIGPSPGRNGALKKLGNMVNLMNDTLGDYNCAHSLYGRTFIDNNRAEAIAWMKQVVIGFKISSEARDTGILIYDKFISLMVLEDPTVLSDINFISYTAAVSIVLGTKLHDGRKCLSLVGFKDFRIETLKHFECLILNKIGFSIAPQVTPTAFAYILINLWSPSTDKCPHLRICDSLISKFWEEPRSLLFAPSTIAIAALILSFSILHLDCSDWLGSLPNFCLPLLQPSSSKASNPRFDIDSCLRCFKIENTFCTRSPQTNQSFSRLSPTSIAGDDVLDSPISRSADCKRKLDGDLDYSEKHSRGEKSRARSFVKPIAASDLDTSIPHSLATSETRLLEIVQNSSTEEQQQQQDPLPSV